MALRSKRSQKKLKPDIIATITAPSESKSRKRRKWCVLFGFKVDDPDEVGFLSFRDQRDLALNPRASIYRIVPEVEDAKHFPCENYLLASGFAPPEKWLEFFKQEDELKDWRFHLVKRTTTNEKMTGIQANTKERKRREDTTCG